MRQGMDLGSTKCANLSLELPALDTVRQQTPGSVSHRLFMPSEFNLPPSISLGNLSDRTHNANTRRRHHSMRTAKTTLSKTTLSVQDLSKHEARDIPLLNLDGINGDMARKNVTITPEICRVSPSPTSEKDELDIKEEDFDTFREWTEKLAEYEVDHDWLLKEHEQLQISRLNVTCNRLKISLPDDDALDAIHRRLEEIRSMVKPHAELRHVLDDMAPEQKAIIKRIQEEDVEVIKRVRRKEWKAIDRFRETARMVSVLALACKHRVKYLKEEKLSMEANALKRMRKNKEKTSPVVEKSTVPRGHAAKSSLGYEMQIALAMCPEYRDEWCLKRAVWVLRATKAFKSLFPEEMETELARVVSYERYDDGRIIAYQAKAPERFYHVLTGKVRKVREYTLSHGNVLKPMGHLFKGMTTDPEELEKGWYREYNLVAKGNVEVLIIQKDDFMRLQHTTQGMPMEFLKSIELFKEFPTEELDNNPEAIEYRFYGQNRVIIRDSNRTPWIHIVKSGSVRVVRMQNVIDIRNEDRFDTQSTEELGCGRTFSHASAMLSILSKQKKMKAQTESHDLFLPIVAKNRHLVTNESTPRSDRKSKQNPRKVADREKISETEITIVKPDEDTEISSSTKLDLIQEDETLLGASETKPRAKMRRASFLPQINIPAHNDSDFSDDESFQPSGTFLTREKTKSSVQQNRRKETVHRRAYLQLDILKPGDIFGTEHLGPALASEDRGYSLVSNGAEILKISKRFFLQHAKNNTMLRVETMHRQYMTPDEAKSRLHSKETWDHYKTILLQRIVGNMTAR